MAEIRIPERKIAIQTPNLQTQDVRVNMPQEAFGGGIANSLSNMGKQIEDTGDLVEKKQKEKLTQKALDIDTQFKKDLMNSLYSNQSENITDTDGNIVPRPIGYLNRELGLAIGAKDEYENNTQILKDKYLKDQPKNLQRVLKNMFASSELAGLDNVIRHEAKQESQYKMNSLDSNLTTKIDEIVLNPNTEFMNKNLSEGRGAILEMMRGRGYDNDTIGLKIKEFNDKAITTTIGSLLDLNNYNQAKLVLDNQKDNITPDLYTKINSKIDDVKTEQTQLNYSQSLLNKFGLDKQKADAYILADKSLDGVAKIKQQSNFDKQFNIKQDEIKINQNNIVQNLYSQIDAISKSNYPDGYNKSIKMIRNSGLPLDQQRSMMGVADDIFGAGDKKKTNQDIWYQVYDKVSNGEITNINELRKYYGQYLSDADMRSFAKSMESGETKDKFNKWSLSSTGNNILKDSGIDPQEYGKFWEYNAAQLHDYEKKLGRPLTNDEQTKVLTDSVNTVKIKHAWYTFSNEKGHVFDLPTGAIKDKNTGKYLAPNSNGVYVPVETLKRK